MNFLVNNMCFVQLYFNDYCRIVNIVNQLFICIDDHIQNKKRRLIAEYRVEVERIKQTIGSPWQSHPNLRST